MPGRGGAGQRPAGGPAALRARSQNALTSPLFPSRGLLLLLRPCRAPFRWRGLLPWRGLLRPLRPWHGLLRPLRSRRGLLRPLCLWRGQLRCELLPAQRPLHEIRGARGGNQTAPLTPVGSEHRVQPTHRKHAAKLGPGCAVPLARPLHTGGQVAPGQRGKSDGMALQNPVQPVVGRDHIQQPCHRGPLEILAARRMDPGWPSRWQIRDHTLTVADYRTGVLARAGQERRPATKMSGWRLSRHPDTWLTGAAIQIADQARRDARLLAPAVGASGRRR